MLLFFSKKGICMKYVKPKTFLIGVTGILIDSKDGLFCWELKND